MKTKFQMCFYGFTDTLTKWVVCDLVNRKIQEIGRTRDNRSQDVGGRTGNAYFPYEMVEA
jgi:uncharacterized protein YifN (PemK superfamily)